MSVVSGDVLVVTQLRAALSREMHALSEVETGRLLLYVQVGTIRFASTCKATAAFPFL